MIPGLEVDAATATRVESTFSGWSDHFRRRLREHGIPGLLLEYEQLVRSVETHTCDHGGGPNVGEEWRRCCGISYEYVNDLAVRDALDQIVTTVGVDSVQAIVAALRPLDDRLYRLYEHRPNRVGRWWHMGLPVGVET